MAEQIARIRLIHTAKVGEKFEIASVRAMGSLTGRVIARSSKGGHTLRSASPPRDNMDGIHLWWRENLRVAKMVCVYDEPDGRGNLRVAKTPPLQSALEGRLWRGMPYQPRPLQKSIKRCDVLHRGKACDKRLNPWGSFC